MAAKQEDIVDQWKLFGVKEYFLHTEKKEDGKAVEGWDEILSDLKLI